MYTSIRSIGYTPVIAMAFLGLSFSSCNTQKAEPVDTAELAFLEEEPVRQIKSERHEYGGWSCPDNFGFVPVDVRELDQVPVVSDRLPTREEASNGTSLIFVDTAKYPNAQALDLDLPRLARVYSPYSLKNELVIVIQALVIDSDTIVGYRYAHGGNGSAWLNEVELLSDVEAEEMGAQPFVYERLEISALQGRVWDVITAQSTQEILGSTMHEPRIAESDFDAGSWIEFKNENGDVIRKGLISASWDSWGIKYLQIDYNFEGRHYVEKFVVYFDEFSNRSELVIASGPYPEDFEAEQAAWKNWILKVKEISESSSWLVSEDEV
jgi:hypothetical protein